MSVRIISSEQVNDLLSMADCIDLMQNAMAAVSTGTVSVPQRTFVGVSKDTAKLGLMPGTASDPDIYGVKIISLHPTNPDHGLPAIQGFIALFDFDKGSLTALIDAASVTAIRTAAASGLATRLLARADARSCGIFGTGVQALQHMVAMKEVRDIKEFLLWGRSEQKALQLADTLRFDDGTHVRVTHDPAEAAACDIICTLTASPEPVLKGEWVKQGAHINLVGAHEPDKREADTPLMCQATIYTDLMTSAKKEAGDIIIPVQENAISCDDIRGEIGQVVIGELPGRTSSKEVTLYKSLGIASQDLFAASHILKQAITKDLGSVVAL